MKKRENVWIAVAGIVEIEGKYLVVKKKYSGLKGKWSFPAGFVDEGETMEDAVKREVFEETGIHAEVMEFAGIRTGVINHTISDNMVLFYMRPIGGFLQPEEKELFDAQFISREELIQHPQTSQIVLFFLQEAISPALHVHPLAIDQVFGYTDYKILAPKRNTTFEGGK
ncbi:NUDIX domain-containing protein [Massilibacterium senegalense]|uniref:NUDIX domain-containing protein n=1 Tax=Massilibacterium senegalense TaxID=1632858 RepID=UPI0007857EF6|nr:NUDIX hydrolase [Massilibacterium senegalense]